MREIVKYDLEGNFLENVSAKNLTELAIDLNISYTTLSDCLNGRILSCSNFQFRNKTDRCPTKIGDITDINRGLQGKLVIKKYNGSIIASYKDVNEASRKNNISATEIYYAIRVGSITNEYTFKYGE